MFAKKLNEIRKANGLTAQEMADHLQMGIRSYRNYESGDREPSLNVLIAIADKLNVSLDILLCRDEFLSKNNL